MNNSFWSSFWGQMSIELIGGIIGAFIFLFLVLIFLRPHINISNFICVYRPTGAQPPVYYFKIVNLSFFSAHDVDIELFEVKRIPMGGGKYNSKLEKLNLVLSHISHIPRRPLFWQKRNDNNHCLVIRCHDNLNSILNIETQGIVLKISLKHGLTGLAKVIEQEYGNEEDIKDGKFRTGTNFGIV